MKIEDVRIGMWVRGEAWVLDIPGISTSARAGGIVTSVMSSPCEKVVFELGRIRYFASPQTLEEEDDRLRSGLRGGGMKIEDARIGLRVAVSLEGGTSPFLGEIVAVDTRCPPHLALTIRREINCSVEEATPTTASIRAK